MKKDEASAAGPEHLNLNHSKMQRQMATLHEMYNM